MSNLLKLQTYNWNLLQNLEHNIFGKGVINNIYFRNIENYNILFVEMIYENFTFLYYGGDIEEIYHNRKSITIDTTVGKQIEHITYGIGTIKELIKRENMSPLLKIDFNKKEKLFPTFNITSEYFKENLLPTFIPSKETILFEQQIFLTFKELTELKTNCSVEVISYDTNYSIIKTKKQVEQTKFSQKGNYSILLKTNIELKYLGVIGAGDNKRFVFVSGKPKIVNRAKNHDDCNTISLYRFERGGGYRGNESLTYKICENSIKIIPNYSKNVNYYYDPYYFLKKEKVTYSNKGPSLIGSGDQQWNNQQRYKDISYQFSLYDDESNDDLENFKDMYYRDSLTGWPYSDNDDVL